MDKIIRTDVTIASGKLKPVIKRQEGFFPFTERPSDKYQLSEEDSSQSRRINAFDLFSFFTADIIKKRVVFVR